MSAPTAGTGARGVEKQLIHAQHALMELLLMVRVDVPATLAPFTILESVPFAPNIATSAPV